MFLADFGAEVVKVEPPGGDPWRHRPGSAVWNRGRRAAVVDRNEPGSLAAYEELLAGADVLVTGEAVGVAAGVNDGLVQLVVPPYLDGAAWPFTEGSEGMLA